MRSLAPIVIFGYNRPDHLERTLSTLAAADLAGQSDLKVFCDGPKPNADPARVEAVRRLANDPKWRALFKSVSVSAAEANQGLARSIIGGVSTVLESADRVIVLEDDLLVSRDFLRFMNDCLDFYRDNQKVGSVTAFCPLDTLPPGYPHDVIAVPRNSSQGWGIWADRWREIDWNARAAARVWSDPVLRARFDSAGNDRANRLRQQLVGKIDSWSIRFGLWQIVTNRHTIYPVHNRIINIGYDGSGVHSGVGQPKNATMATLPDEIRLADVEVDPRVLDAFYRVYSSAAPRRWLRWLRLWLLTRGMR